MLSLPYITTCGNCKRFRTRIRNAGLYAGIVLQVLSGCNIAGTQIRAGVFCGVIVNGTKRHCGTLIVCCNHSAGFFLSNYGLNLQGSSLQNSMIYGNEEFAG